MNTPLHLARNTVVWLALAALAGPAGFAQDDANATATPDLKVGKDVFRRTELRLAQNPEPPEAPEPPEPPEVAAEWQGDLRRAQSEVGRAMRDAQRHIAGIHFSYNGADAPRILIVPGAQTSDEVIAQNREDLAVMSRILMRAASPGKSPRSGLIVLDGFRFGSHRDLEAMQLDGFGAVFLLDVDYPLFPPPAASGAPATAKGPKDTTWEKTRRELTGDSDADEESDDALDLRGRRPGPPYDAERVAGLKRTLIESLRHAHNLRGLKQDDWVVVQVSGPSSSRPAPAATEKGADNNSNNKRNFARADRGEGGATSVLTLRVHKADVDNFALDRVQLDEFGRAVQVTERIESAAAPAKKGE